MWVSSRKEKVQLKNPVKVECLLCEDVIFSPYSGCFVSCKCGQLSVDQTDFYIRVCGNEGTYQYYGVENE